MGSDPGNAIASTYIGPRDEDISYLTGPEEGAEDGLGAQSSFIWVPRAAAKEVDDIADSGLGAQFSFTCVRGKTSDVGGEGGAQSSFIWVPAFGVTNDIEGGVESELGAQFSFIWVPVDADNEDEDDGDLDYEHLSDEELTGDAETALLRGFRNCLHGIERDQKVTTETGEQDLSMSSTSGLLMDMGNSNDPGINQPAITAAAPKNTPEIALQLAQRILVAVNRNLNLNLSLNLNPNLINQRLKLKLSFNNIADSELLARVINGTPSQFYSWVSSSLTSPDASSNSTTATSYFDINGADAFHPSVSGVPLTTLQTSSSPLTPDVYNTPPTSYENLPDPSSDDGNRNIGEEGKAMSFGKNYVDGTHGENNSDHSEEDYEFIFAMDEDDAPAPLTAMAATTASSFIHNRARDIDGDFDVMDDTFLVVETSTSTDTTK